MPRLPAPGNMPENRGIPARTMTEQHIEKPKAGFVKRLLAFKDAADAKRINIRIAPLARAAGPHIDRHVLAAFDGHKNIKARPASEPVEFNPAEATTDSWADAVKRAETQLKKTGADILIWGEAEAAGTTMTLRFLSAQPMAIDRFGYFDVRSELHLPVDFDTPLAELLVSVSLAAASPAVNSKAQIVKTLLMGTADTVLKQLDDMPEGLTSWERASIQCCAANVLAINAVHQNHVSLFFKAAETYQAALTTLTSADHPFQWALANLNLAACLLTMAERDNDQDIFNESVQACENALSIMNQQNDAWLWAMAQSRLGLSLYKVDLNTGDTDFLKRSLGAFQAALKVFTRNSHPRLWADIMNNFAQAALVFGEQMHNDEVVKKAIHACNESLEVRTKDDNPLQWAATQNNLGSALFMLGKMNKEVGSLEGALEAFSQALEVYTAHGAERLAAITVKNQEHVKRLIDKR